MSKNKTINPANEQAADDAGLAYVSDDGPGITRKKAGSKFIYLDPHGKKITSKETIHRIDMLAIPPAYRDVWICPNPRGHIQAVGRDDRGRKQYRYHEKWRAVRDETKYGRMTEFAKALPRIRRTVARHLRMRALPREKVLAAVVKFMETTLIRVGNDEYAKTNKSFGLTTLRDRHAKITGGKIKLEFRGKSGVEHQFEITDPRLASIAKQCQDLPGQELFQYLDDDGKVCDVGSSDVNDYLRDIAGEEFTAKDFRTWAGTVLAAVALAELGKFDSEAAAKRNVLQAIDSVAGKLGNTRAVCRKCYIHPEVLGAYMDGNLGVAALGNPGLVDQLAKSAGKMAGSMAKLRPEEAAVLALLARRLAEARSAKRSESRTPAPSGKPAPGRKRASGAAQAGAGERSVAKALRRSLTLVNARAGGATAHRRKAS